MTKIFGFGLSVKITTKNKTRKPSNAFHDVRNTRIIDTCIRTPVKGEEE